MNLLLMFVQTVASVMESSDSSNHSSDNDGDSKMLITMPGDSATGTDPLTIVTSGVAATDDSPNAAQ